MQLFYSTPAGLKAIYSRFNYLSAAVEKNVCLVKIFHKFSLDTVKKKWARI